MLSLVAVFRHRGWRFPLGDDDVLEVFRGFELVGRIPVAVVVSLVAHHVEGAAVEARLRKALGMAAPRTDATEAKKPLRAVNGRRLRGR